MHLSIEFLYSISFIGVAGMSYYVFSKYKKPSTDYEPQNIKEELEDDTDNEGFEAENLHTTLSIELYKDAVVEKQALRELQSKQDFTIERTKRMPLEELHKDPGLWAAYVRGWEDRTADVHLNIRAWNPSPTRPQTILTPSTHRHSHSDEQTAGCEIKPEGKKLRPAATSARIPAPQKKKSAWQKKRDMARMAEFLAKKRGQQTGLPPTTLQQDTATEPVHRPAAP